MPGAAKKGRENARLRTMAQTKEAIQRASKIDGQGLLDDLWNRHAQQKDNGSARVTGVALRDSFAEYPWADLSELSQAIAAAKSDEKGLAIARNYHLVDKNGRLLGAKKPLMLKNGTKTSIRILGFRHDELASGKKAGISFEFADTPAVYRMNPGRTNAGGWEKSEMRGWLNGEFFALLPDDLRAGIAEVRKRTNNRGEVERNDVGCVTATEDKLWLLSMAEVYGRLAAQHDNVPPSPATYDAEGTQYQLYADKGVTTSNHDFCKKKRGTAYSVWWLRSPIADDSNWFHIVYSDGDWGVDGADSEWGVSPGFCF